MKTMTTCYGPYDVIHMDGENAAGEPERKVRIVNVRDREMAEISAREWRRLKADLDRMGYGGQEACAVVMQLQELRRPYEPA